MRKYSFIAIIFCLIFAFVGCKQNPSWGGVLPPWIINGVKTPYDVSSEQELKVTLEESAQVRLTSDISITVEVASSENPFYFDDGRSYTIDLNGYGLSLSYDYDNELQGQAAITVTGGSSLVINGVLGEEVDLEIVENGSDPVSGGIAVLSGSSLIFNNVDYHSNHTGILVDGNASSFVADNSTITADGAYGITTNAKDDLSDGLNIRIENTVVDTSEGWASAAVLFNVNGNLEIVDSDLIGGIQGLIVRGGKATVSGGSISAVGNAKISDYSQYGYIEEEPWSDGNGVAYAALVVGNAGGKAADGSVSQSNGGYSPVTDVTVTNGTEIQMTTNDWNKEALDIFIASINSENDAESKTILHTDDQQIIDYIKENLAFRGNHCYLQLNGENEELLEIPEEGFGFDEKAETYTVYTSEGLLNCTKRSDFLTKNIKLARSIDLSELPAAFSDAASNWTPIGSTAEPFTGVFDGNGHTISGAVINASENSSSQRYGLFGTIGESGVVKNLNVENVSFSNTENTVGGIAGENKGLIENCTVSGSIEGLNAGGITGSNKGSIAACINYASVTGTGSGSNAGGISGSSSSGSRIICCVNAGDISYSGFIGGTIGNGANCAIAACYNIGSLSSGQTAIGGIAGFGNSNNNKTCYWLPLQGADNGIGQDSAGGMVGFVFPPSNTNAIPVDGSSVTWEMAMESMNQILGEEGTSYRYAVNGDSEESLPLIIVEG